MKATQNASAAISAGDHTRRQHGENEATLMCWPGPSTEVGWRSIRDQSFLQAKCAGIHARQPVTSALIALRCGHAEQQRSSARKLTQLWRSLSHVCQVKPFAESMMPPSNFWRSGDCMLTYWLKQGRQVPPSERKLLSADFQGYQRSSPAVAKHVASHALKDCSTCVTGTQATCLPESMPRDQQCRPDQPRRQR